MTKYYVLKSLLLIRLLQTDSDKRKAIAYVPKTNEIYTYEKNKIQTS